MSSQKIRLFELAIKSAEYGIVILDARKADLPIVVVNPATQKITGYSEKELLGKGFWALDASRPLSPEVEELRNAIRDGRSCEVILSNSRKDGSEFWEQLLLSPIRDDDVVVTYFVGLHRDVTSQVESQHELELVAQKLEASQRRYRTLFESSEDEILIHDLEGRVLDANQKAIERFGWSREEFLNLRVENLYPKEELSNSRKALQRVVDTGRHRFETQFVSRIQQVFPAEVSASLFELSGQKVVQGIIREISERKQYEKTLAEVAESAAERERQLGAILGTVGEGIVTIDSSGKIVLINPEIERIFGYSIEEIQGESLTILMPPEFRDAHKKGLQRFLKTRRAKVLGQRLELEGLRKSGERFPLELLISLTQVGGADHFTGAIRDISVRKKAEQALKQRTELLRAITRGSRRAT
jgi:PAS domain S-box-containing protein